eukprot:g4475.t1
MRFTQRGKVSAQQKALAEMHKSAKQATEATVGAVVTGTVLLVIGVVTAIVLGITAVVSWFRYQAASRALLQLEQVQMMMHMDKLKKCIETRQLRFEVAIYEIALSTYVSVMEGVMIQLENGSNAVEERILADAKARSIIRPPRDDVSALEKMRLRIKEMYPSKNPYGFTIDASYGPPNSRRNEDIEISFKPTKEYARVADVLEPLLNNFALRNIPVVEIGGAHRNPGSCKLHVEHGLRTALVRCSVQSLEEKNFFALNCEAPIGTQTRRLSTQISDAATSITDEMSRMVEAICEGGSTSERSVDNQVARVREKANAMMFKAISDTVMFVVATILVVLSAISLSSHGSVDNSAVQHHQARHHVAIDGAGRYRDAASMSQQETLAMMKVGRLASTKDLVKSHILGADAEKLHAIGEGADTIKAEINAIDTLHGEIHQDLKLAIDGVNSFGSTGIERALSAIRKIAGLCSNLKAIKVVEKTVGTAAFAGLSVVLSSVGLLMSIKAMVGNFMALFKDERRFASELKQVSIHREHLNMEMNFKQCTMGADAASLLRSQYERFVSYADLAESAIDKRLAKDPNATLDAATLGQGLKRSLGRMCELDATLCYRSIGKGPIRAVVSAALKDTDFFDTLKMQVSSGPITSIAVSANAAQAIKLEAMGYVPVHPRPIVEPVPGYTAGDIELRLWMCRMCGPRAIVSGSVEWTRQRPSSQEESRGKSYVQLDPKNFLVFARAPIPPPPPSGIEKDVPLSAFTITTARRRNKVLAKERDIVKVDLSGVPKQSEATVKTVHPDGSIDAEYTTSRGRRDNSKDFVTDLRVVTLRDVDKTAACRVLGKYLEETEAHCEDRRQRPDTMGYAVVGGFGFWRTDSGAVSLSRMMTRIGRWNLRQPRSSTDTINMHMHHERVGGIIKYLMITRGAGCVAHHRFRETGWEVKYSEGVDDHLRRYDVWVYRTDEATADAALDKARERVFEFSKSRARRGEGENEEERFRESDSSVIETNEAQRALRHRRASRKRLSHADWTLSPRALIESGVEERSKSEMWMAVGKKIDPSVFARMVSQMPDSRITRAGSSNFNEVARRAGEFKVGQSVITFRGAVDEGPSCPKDPCECRIAKPSEYARGGNQALHDDPFLSPDTTVHLNSGKTHTVGAEGQFGLLCRVRRGQLAPFFRKRKQIARSYHRGASVYARFQGGGDWVEAVIDEANTNRNTYRVMYTKANVFASDVPESHILPRGTIGDTIDGDWGSLHLPKMSDDQCEVVMKPLSIWSKTVGFSVDKYYGKTKAERLVEDLMFYGQSDDAEAGDKAAEYMGWTPAGDMTLSEGLEDTTINKVRQLSVRAYVRFRPLFDDDSENSADTEDAVTPGGRGDDSDGTLSLEETARGMKRLRRDIKKKHAEREADFSETLCSSKCHFSGPVIDDGDDVKVDGRGWIGLWDHVWSNGLYKCSKRIDRIGNLMQWDEDSVPSTLEESLELDRALRDLTLRKEPKPLSHYAETIGIGTRDSRDALDRFKNALRDATEKHKCDLRGFFPVRFDTSACESKGSHRYLSFDGATGVVHEMCTNRPQAGQSALPIGPIYWIEMLLSYSTRDEFEFPSVRELERAWDLRGYSVLPDIFTAEVTASGLFSGGSLKSMKSRHLLYRVWIRPDSRIRSKTCDEVCPRHPAHCTLQRREFRRSARLLGDITIASRDQDEPVDDDWDAYASTGVDVPTYPELTTTSNRDRSKRAILSLASHLVSVHRRMIEAYFAGAIVLEKLYERDAARRDAESNTKGDALLAHLNRKIHSFGLSKDKDATCLRRVRNFEAELRHNKDGKSSNPELPMYRAMSPFATSCSDGLEPVLDLSECQNKVVEDVSEDSRSRKIEVFRSDLSEFWPSPVTNVTLVGPSGIYDKILARIDEAMRQTFGSIATLSPRCAKRLSTFKMCVKLKDFESRSCNTTLTECLVLSESEAADSVTATAEKFCGSKSIQQKWQFCKNSNVPKTTEELESLDGPRSLQSCVMVRARCDSILNPPEGTLEGTFWSMCEIARLSSPELEWSDTVIDDDISYYVMYNRFLYLLCKRHGREHLVHGYGLSRQGVLYAPGDTMLLGYHARQTELRDEIVTLLKKFVLEDVQAYQWTKSYVENCGLALSYQDLDLAVFLDFGVDVIRDEEEEEEEEYEDEDEGEEREKTVKVLSLMLDIYLDDKCTKKFAWGRDRFPKVNETVYRKG